MRCKYCNSEINQKMKFCTRCGKTIDKNDYIEKKIEPPKKIQSSEHIRKTSNRIESTPKSSKNIIITVVALAIVLVAVAVGIGAFRYFNSASKVIEKFREGISNNDTKVLSTIIETSDSRVQINDDVLEPFVQSFANKPSLLNTVIASLEATSNSEKSLLAEARDESLIKLKKKDRFLIGPKYYIELVPVYIRIESKYDNVTISLNEKNILKTSNDKREYEMGPFIPADYVITSLGESYDNSAKEILTLSFLSDNQGSVKEISPLGNFRHVNITSNMMDATIYINGENTGFKVSESEKLGLVKNNSSITAAITSSTGTFKSNTVSVYSDNVDLRFDNVSTITNAPDSYTPLTSLESSIKSTVSGYLNNFDDAVNYNDFTSIKEYLYYNSEIYNTQMKYVENTYKQGIRLSYTGSDISKIVFDSDKSTGEVYVTETFIVTKESDTSTTTNSWRYGFKFNPISNKYQLTSIRKQ